MSVMGASDKRKCEECLIPEEIYLKMENSFPVMTYCCCDENVLNSDSIITHRI